MPVDYKKYPANWKSEIRPAIMERAGHKCEICGVKNHDAVFRGLWNGKEAYQDIDGNAFWYPSGEPIKGPDCYAMLDPLRGDENQLAIKIVLTIAHLNHDPSDNRLDNLKAMCQKCHLAYDKDLHAHNSRVTRAKKKGLIEIPFA